MARRVPPPKVRAIVPRGRSLDAMPASLPSRVSLLRRSDGGRACAPPWKRGQVGIIGGVAASPGAAGARFGRGWWVSTRCALEPPNMSMTEPREPRERPDRPANRTHNHRRTTTRATAINPCPLTTAPPYGRHRGTPRSWSTDDRNATFPLTRTKRHTIASASRRGDVLAVASARFHSVGGVAGSRQHD
jgi:hypothetical protein